MNPFHAWLWRMQRGGNSLDALSEMTGISRDAINRAIYSHRYERGEVMMKRCDLIKAYQEEGKSIREISEMYFCSYEAVRWHMIRYGISRRPRGKTNNIKNDGQSDFMRFLRFCENYFNDNPDKHCGAIFDEAIP